MLSVSINVIRDALNIDPCVGFLIAAPGFFGPAPAVVEATNVERPGSGMIDDRRDPPLPESEREGEPG